MTALPLSSPDSTPPLAPRRGFVLTGFAVAVLALAGCSSRPKRRAERSPTRPAARGRGGNPPPRGPALALDPAGREALVAGAMLLVNTPYRYGGNTPEGGFDCSGLVSYTVADAVSALGRAPALPRTTAQWAAASTPVANDALARGDLVFFNTSGTPFSHMGIYVGDGQFVHAPSTGGVVRKDRLDNRYFSPRYQGARRVFAR